jgi:hypothetical protein
MNILNIWKVVGMGILSSCMNYKGAPSAVLEQPPLQHVAVERAVAPRQTELLEQAKEVYEKLLLSGVPVVL